jgi:hypothetical protein
MFSIVLTHTQYDTGIVGTSDDISFINAMRLALLDGDMEDRKIDVEVTARPNANDKGSVTIDMSNPGIRVCMYR